MVDDTTLLRRYAVDRSEEAFAEFVRRHLPLVYSAALRRLGGDAHRAQDVTQTVFCAVARHAQRLSKHATIAGWLYTATRYAVTDVVRTETRRRAREEEAHRMEQVLSDVETTADWSRLRPVLDTAMDELGNRDREAVLLRYFEARPFADIGALLGVSEDAARKRVERALDRLRSALQRRRLASTSAALAAILAGETISAAPAGLASAVTGAAISAGSAATGAAALLAFTKLQVGIAATVIAGGAAGLLLQQATVSSLREDVARATQTVTALTRENTQLAETRAAADVEIARLQTQVATLERAASARPTPEASSRPVSRSPATESTRSAGTEPARAAATTDPNRRKTDLHRRYDPFLFAQGLTPEQADRFVELKIAIAEAQDDLQRAVRLAGAEGGTAGVEAMRAQLVTPMWDEIRQLLGREGYARYGEYEHNSALRLSYVEPMLPVFASADAPLSSAQADALVQAFAQNHRTVRMHPSDISMTGFVDWNAIATQAAGFLSPKQADLLRSYAEKKATR